MPPIRLLSPAVVNRIAAGEVVERPSAALKELLENALDASATEIRVALENGGKSLLVVEDNGHGIAPEELPLAVERHATSKLTDDQLVDIRSFGFRGEALPAIGAVSRLTLTSRNSAITVSGGIVEPVRPAPPLSGTRVEVRDLFYATPARLKFLKSDASELSACVAVFEKQALAQPHVRFTLTHHGRSLRSLPPVAGFVERASALLGTDFVAASKEINAVRGDLRLRGLVASPTFNKANSTSQYVFVGGRPVNDRVLFSAIRAGYADVLSHGRYAAVLLFLEVPPEQVDVNVHPAKIEVRFSDAAAVKSLVIGAIREAVTASAGAFSHALPLRPVGYAPTAAAPQRTMPYGAYPSLPPLQRHLGEHTPQSFAPSGRSFTAPDTAERPALETAPAGALGVATAQVFDTYIIAEAGDAVVLVDQHAAHERLVYEQLKAGIAADADSKSQALLIPDVVPLPPAAREALLAHQDALSAMGLELESFGNDALLVRAVPLALGKTSSAGLLSDLAAAILENDSVAALQEKILDVLANVACRRSIKAGQKLNTHEMNALLRQMEETPAAGQCNHGRPTYITLTRSELERLFKR